MPTPFQTHLTFFSTTPHPAALTSSRPLITLRSGLFQSLKLGLNFPVAVLTSLALRFLYGSPYNLWLRPVDVRAVQTRRTMLEDVLIQANGRGLTREDVIGATRAAGKGIADRIHVRGLWAVCADGNGVMGAKEVEACKKGEAMWRVAERRKFRDGRHGEVLPFTRGGPVSVVGHAWFVDKLFGVKVYQSGKDHER